MKLLKFLFNSLAILFTIILSLSCEGDGVSSIQNCSLAIKGSTGENNIKYYLKNVLVRDSVLYYTYFNNKEYYSYDFISKTKGTILSLDNIINFILTDSLKSNRSVRTAVLVEVIDKRYLVFKYTFSLPYSDTIQFYNYRFDILVYDVELQKEIKVGLPINYQNIGFQENMDIVVENNKNGFLIYITSYDNYEKTAFNSSFLISFTFDFANNKVSKNERYLKFLSKSKDVYAFSLSHVRKFGVNYIFVNSNSGFVLDLANNDFEKYFAVSPNDSILFCVFRKSRVSQNEFQQRVILINTYTKEKEIIDFTKIYCKVLQSSEEIYVNFFNDHEIIMLCTDVNDRNEYLYSYNIVSKKLTKLDLDIYN